MSIPRFVAWMLSFSLLAQFANALYGQAYPNKPVRIVTAAAGGGSDFIAREISQGISGPLGQQIIVDNRGTGVLAAEVASKAPPDGYTLLVSGGSLWITPLFRKTPYDPVRDYSPISLIVREVNVLAVHPTLPAKSIKELIALAKARPGALNYSSNGVGSTTHLATELFKAMAGVNMVHVAYQGSAPAIVALISGEAQLIIMDAGLVMPHVASGRLRALAATSLEPSALAPGLPTVAAAVPGYESIGYTALFASGKPPKAIIDRLNQEVVRFLSRADLKERFLKSGIEIVGSSPEQLLAAMELDTRQLSKLIKDIGLRIE